MVRRSPPHGLKSWLRVEPLEDRCVPAAYAATPLPADFPGLDTRLTPDGYYNSADGISRLNAGVVVPKGRYSPNPILLERSFGDIVVFSVSSADSTSVLYARAGSPASHLAIDGGPGVRVSAVTFTSETSGVLPAVFYKRFYREDLSAPGTDEGLWRALPDGQGGLLSGERLAGGSRSAYEQATQVEFYGISHLTQYDGTLYFVAEAHARSGARTVGLYSISTSGAVAGHGNYPAGAQVQGLYATSVGLLAVVNTADDGTELYAGLGRLRDINPGPGHAFPYGLYDAGGAVYFLADDGTYGFEPWVTNGTGARMLKDVNPGLAGSAPENTTDVFAGSAGRVYFAASGTTEFGTPAGVELWVTDGTEAGTRLTKDINPGPGDGILPTLFADAGNVLFSATTGQFVGGRPQFNLWQSDGTPAGTRLVRDFTPEGQNTPGSFFRFGSAIHFGTSVGTGITPWQLSRVPNRAPVLAVPPDDRGAPPGVPFGFALAADTFTDADFDTLTVTVTRDDGSPLPAWLTYDPLTRTFSGTPAAGDAGELKVKVVAADPDGATATARFTVYVDTLVNHSPTVRTAPIDLATRIGFRLDAQLPADTFADADLPAGDFLTLVPSRTDGQPLPEWLKLFGNTVVGTPPLGSYAATTVIPVRVTATDRAGATAAADFTFTVEVIQRPAPTDVYVDRAFPSQTPTDPDGDGPATEFLYDGFNDLQQAIDAVAAGGTVVVRSGFYSAARGGQGGQEGPGGGGAITTRGKVVTIAPGSGAGGADAAQITLGSPLTLDANATLRLSLGDTPPTGAPAAGTDHDAFTGAPIALNGATLALAGGYDYRAGDAFALLAAVAGEFGAIDVSELNSAAGTPQLAYSGGAVLTFSDTPLPAPTVGVSLRAGTAATDPRPTFAVTLDRDASLTFVLTRQLAGGPTVVDTVTLNPSGRAAGTYGFEQPTPLAPGAYRLVVTAASDGGVGSAALDFTVAALELSPADLPAGTVGVGYSQVLTAAGGEAFAVTAGALPAGLTLSADGQLEGTPTTAGTFGFTVTASSPAGVGSRNFILTIATAAVNITVSPPALPGGRVGDAYDHVITAAAGAGVTGPFTFAVLDGELPPDLALTADGHVGGTPTAAGAYGFTVKVTAAAGGFVIVPFAIEVAAAAAPLPQPREPNLPGPVRLTVGRRAGGTPSDLVVRNRDGSVRFNLSAFGGTFAGDVRPVTGDLNGDDIDEIVVTSGAGGAPRVEVYDGKTGALVQNFFAFNPEFRGGATAAVAGGVLVVGAGPGGGPHVKYFANGTEVASFFAFAESFRGGVTLAVGDVDRDGFDVVVVGAATGGGPAVVVFDGATGAFRAAYFVGPEDDRDGVRVALRDLAGDGRVEVVARAAGKTRAYEPLTGREITDLFAAAELESVFA